MIIEKNFWAYVFLLILKMKKTITFPPLPSSVLPTALATVFCCFSCRSCLRYYYFQQKHSNKILNKKKSRITFLNDQIWKLMATENCSFNRINNSAITFGKLAKTPLYINVFLQNKNKLRRFWNIVCI